MEMIICALSVQTWRVGDEINQNVTSHNESKLIGTASPAAPIVIRLRFLSLVSRNFSVCVCLYDCLFVFIFCLVNDSFSLVPSFMHNYIDY